MSRGQWSSGRGECEDSSRVAAHGSSLDAVRQLDDERGAPRRAVILPADRTAGIALESSKRQAAPLGIATLGSCIAAREVNHAERLMEPHCDSRPQASYERCGEARFRFREGTRSRVLLTSDRPERRPAVGEVSVEVDVAGILTGVTCRTVRVEIRDDPQLSALRAWPARETSGNRHSGGLVTMDGSDD